MTATQEGLVLCLATKKAYFFLVSQPPKSYILHRPCKFGPFRISATRLCQEPQNFEAFGRPHMCEFSGFQVKHISAKQNGIADYLYRLFSYKSSVGVIRVVSDENDNYSYNLLSLAH